MTGAAATHKPMADTVMGTIQGGLAAQRLVHTLRHGMPDPDALLRALLDVRTADPGGDQLRGFCREVQKRLEVAR